MGSISLQNVAKQLGHRMVLSGVDLELTSGEIVGVVGPNGAGKTTLFKLILGRFEPDAGTVIRSRGLDVGHLSQEPELDPSHTLHDEALSAFSEVLALETRMHELNHAIAEGHDGPEYEALLEEHHKVEAQFLAADGYAIEQRLEEILGGLGFTRDDYALPVTALSGGQKCRAALAKLLLSDSTYLLLDEPTNHLDIDAVRWLEKFLASHHGGAAIISHDRYLLDRVAQRIIEVDGGTVTSYRGNYSTYVQTREVNRLTQSRQFEKDQDFIAKERDFIARHLAGQRSSEAKGRRTRLERMLKDGEFTTSRPGERRDIKLEFDTQVEEGRTVIETSGLSKSYGPKALFENLSLTVQSGQRLGITGPNGTGKSTLLRILLGRLKADAGEFRIDPKALIGYYAQDATELSQTGTVLSEAMRDQRSLTEQRARTLLGRFLFFGEDVFKPIDRLSGGEQSRVRLVKLLLTQPSVLVLDEPTNHLDIPSREALESALDDYPGTILAVSHDRYFLDRVIERLLVIRPGQIRYFAGNYTRYVEALEEEQAQAARAAARQAEADRAASRQAAERAAVAAGKAAKPQKTKSRFDKMPLDELEGFIVDCERRIASMNERFGDIAVARDPAALKKLNEELEVARGDLAEAEEAWGQRI